MGQLERAAVITPSMCDVNSELFRRPKRSTPVILLRIETDDEEDVLALGNDEGERNRFLEIKTKKEKWELENGKNKSSAKKAKRRDLVDWAPQAASKKRKA